MKNYRCGSKMCRSGAFLLKKLWKLWVRLHKGNLSKFGNDVQPSECDKFITITVDFRGIFDYYLTCKKPIYDFLFLITYFSYFYLFFPTKRGQSARLRPRFVVFADSISLSTSELVEGAHSIAQTLFALHLSSLEIRRRMFCG